LNLIRGNHLDADSLLVPKDFVPPIHYYFPRAEVRGYSDERPTPSDLEASGLTGVLYNDDPVRYERLRIPQQNLIK
jgi:hypothetical protein